MADFESYAKSDFSSISYMCVALCPLRRIGDRWVMCLLLAGGIRSWQGGEFLVVGDEKDFFLMDQPRASLAASG